METYLGENTPKLGFGLMRLPKNEDKSIDIEQTKQMVDAFMDAGMTYFDTAYVYDQGASEKAAKEALVDRYPRESYTLATKMNAWLGTPTKEETIRQFETSLERTGAGYFDYYLLHALQDANWEIYENYGLWDFVKEEKEKGRIRHYGFSCHASPQVLEKLLQDHPDAEFVQLQINYADWENHKVNSRKCYELARKYNKPIVIMEPVKGGSLANPEPAVETLFKEANPTASNASWAIRYAASLPGVITVLSGMSNMEQVQDNLSYMKDFQPLNDEEQAVIEKAQEELAKSRKIACTSCHYCTDGCPQNIPIPEIFAAENLLISGKEKKEAQDQYFAALQGRSRASECIECGQCEGACPQSLPIIELLKSASKDLD